MHHQTLLSLKLVVLMLSTGGTYEMTGKLTRAYFENFIIKQIVVFGCWESYERVKFLQLIMHGNCEALYVNIQEDLDMTKILTVNYYKLGIVLDLNCPSSQSIFDQFSKQHLRYNESYFWLMPTAQSTFPDYFHQLPLNIANEMTLAIRDKNGYSLYDVYNPSYRHGGKLNVTYMGNWTANDQDGAGRLNIVLTQYKYNRRGNLYGLVLNSSIVVDAKPVPDYWTYIHNPINRHFDTMHRYNYALTRQLRDYYNFTMNLTRGTTWGYLINGTFNGIIGDMIKGIVDFSSTPFQLKPERLDVCEWTVQAFYARTALMFRHPKVNALRNPFLKPFNVDAWYGMLIFIGIIWSFFYMVAKIEQLMTINNISTDLLIHPASETGLIMTAAICQQGLSDGPRFYSGRIIFLSLFLWGFLLFQYYCASIVGSLLAETPRWINTLKDVTESNLEIGIDDMAYNHDWFRTTTDPLVKKLYRTKVAPNKHRKKAAYYDFNTGMKKMRRGGFAFQVDVMTAYKYIEDTFNAEEICDLAEVVLFAGKHTTTATAKHSPFKKMVTYGLRKVVEHGMADRLRYVWMPQKPECPESHRSAPVPIMITEFAPAVILLSFGCIQSVFVMVVEIMANRWIERRQVSDIADEVDVDEPNDYLKSPSLDWYQNIVTQDQAMD